MSDVIPASKTPKKAKAGKKGKTRKHTPCWMNYKANNRFYHNKIKKMSKHLVKCPNDSQSANRLTAIKAAGQVKLT